MKRLKGFKEYLKEGVKDMMTPKSEDEIQDKLKNLSSDEILQNLYTGKDSILYDLFEYQQIINMVKDLPSDRMGVFLRVALSYRDYKFTKILLDAGADPNLDYGWPLRYVTNWKENELATLLKEYGAILYSQKLTNESLRDKMTPITDDKKEELKDKILGMRKHDRVRLMLRYPDLFKKDELRKEINSIENDDLKNIWILHTFANLFTDEEKDEAAKSLIQEYFNFAYINGKRLLDEVILGDRWSFFDEYKVGVDDDGKNLYLFKDIIYKIVKRTGGANYLVHTFIHPKHFVKLDEGVRDMMTPKSDEDIDKILGKMSYPEVAAKMLYAAQEGDTNWVEKILDKGMSPNCQTRMGTTPLMFAVMRGYYDLAELLLKRGARVNIKNYNDKTVFDILKSTPADFVSYNLTDEQKRNFQLYGQKVYDLLKSYSKGINEGIRDKMTPKSEDELKMSLDKYTPREKMLMAIESDITWLAKDAIKNGLDVNQSVNNRNFTYLMAACDMLRFEIVKMLIEAGANVNNKDNYGNSVLSVAYHQNNKEESQDIIAILKRNGAKIR